jgi:hypothetical protein
MNMITDSSYPKSVAGGSPLPRKVAELRTRDRRLKRCLLLRRNLALRAIGEPSVWDLRGQS